MISTTWSGYRPPPGPATEMGYALVAAQGEMYGFGSLGACEDGQALTFVGFGISGDAYQEVG